MSGDSQAAATWWRPEEDHVRRRWCEVLARAGVERPAVTAALTAAAARLRLTEPQLAAAIGLQRSWLPRPTPRRAPGATRSTQPKGAPAMADDRLRDLHHFMLELTDLTRKYGLELSEVEEDGLIVYDQEHDTVLAHGVIFDDDEDEYHFSPYWNGRRDPSVPV